jgi:hypothetical protein
MSAIGILVYSQKATQMTAIIVSLDQVKEPL